MFSKRLLAWQLMVQNQIDRDQLSWVDMIARIFDVTLNFAVAIISDPASAENEELDEWISLAQNLLRNMGSSNLLASKAVGRLGTIRQRTYSAMERHYNPSRSRTSIDEYLQKATQTMAQPQPSMSDLFGIQEITETIWQEEVNIYSIHFPGLETVCGDEGLMSLNRFLDGCIPVTH
ncbi:hypothetical protein H0H81_007794 [Sphagnurus paluster]|uniref:Uncharacterized protein n=1 Tax=Sphagnurus paluster TaxID=117069 RepID=A0A9P7GPV7_9AGAR|nr:hypothetical protein H0H81_007794 [Sphagnurus paluster]